jgi:hypothetical protein
MMTINFTFGILYFVVQSFLLGYLEGYVNNGHMNQKSIVRKKKLDSSFFPSRPPTRIPTGIPSTSSPSNNYGQLASVNIFQYTGMVQSVTIPTECTSIYIYMWYESIIVLISVSHIIFKYIFWEGELEEQVRALVVQITGEGLGPT